MQLPYRVLFWTGFTAMLVMACLPSRGNFSGKNIASLRLDYLLHFTVYLAICLYFIIGRKYGLHLFRKNSVIKFVAVIVFLASVTELMQLAVPSRAFNVYDWIANISGVVTGILLLSPKSPKSSKSSKSPKSSPVTRHY